jgi:hypothetical protein
MVLAHSDFGTQKIFSKNHLQFGHVPSEMFTSLSSAEEV